MYNYLDNMENNILDYINENISIEDYENDREDLEEKLNEDLFNCDSVTGNASGSYTFNRWTAEEYVSDNMDLLNDAVSEFGIDSETVAEKFLSNEWEYFDVTIRCYLLGQAISKALDNFDF